MPPKTRAKAPSNKTRSETTAKVSTSITSLPPTEDSPPQLCVLPKDASPEARFVSLRNPASTAGTSRYFVCPVKGFFELVKIGGSKKDGPRSWIVSSRGVEADDGEGKSAGEDSRVDSQQNSQQIKEEEDNSNIDTNTEEEEGYILSQPTLLLATPLDPLFLLLPHLTAASQTNPSTKEYLAPSDYISLLTTSSPHLSSLLSTSSHLTRILEARIDAVSDVMDMGDGEKMYAFSREKLACVLVGKARRMVDGGELPRSLEERFVKGVLEVPVLGERREGEGISIADRHTKEDTEKEDDNDKAESQRQTAEVVFCTGATSETSSSSSTPPASIMSLLRLRIALDFLLKSYLPSSLAPLLQPHFNTLISFQPLDLHLSHIAALKKEAAALRSLSDNISRKRPLGDDGEDDDEVAFGKGEAKRRKEEEDRKRKLEKEKSVGMRRLGKVDVSGMKKMSSFFTKTAVGGGKK